MTGDPHHSARSMGYFGPSFWDTTTAPLGMDADYPRALNTYIDAAIAYDLALIDAALIRAIETTSTGVLVLYDRHHRVISAEPCDTVPAYEIHERFGEP